MKVTFANFGDMLASSRLRAIIPQRELAKLGYERGNDVLVYGKHWIEMDQTKGYGKKVFDVTDDHFDNQHGDYYREHIAAADAVTCSSHVLWMRIKQQTGRGATIIPEPYEGPECKPDIGPGLLWFGHGSNIKDFLRLGLKAKVLSNLPGYEQWTPETFNIEISKPCIVIIPTGKSMAKSENRMVESIRRGRYVCAEYLPAYEPFYEFFPEYDIKSHVHDALYKKEDSLKRIALAQDYIRDRYAPKTIALKWKEVIDSL